MVLEYACGLNEVHVKCALLLYCFILVFIGFIWVNTALLNELLHTGNRE